MTRSIAVSLFLLSLLSTATYANTYPQGKVEIRSFRSAALAGNLIGLDPRRRISIYLPPDYEKTERRYPVMYYLPFGKQLMEDGQLNALLDAAIAEQRIPPFILVSGDFGLPDSINFFGNGPTTGRWLDHIRNEVVPYADKHYRTLRNPAARGIGGHFLGGYAAFRLAMQHPDIFTSIYGLHPVATDTGERSMLYMPDWKEIHSARSYADLKAPYSSPFVAMAQAHLPNPKRPPFYADFIVEMADGELVPDQAHIQRLKKNFLLADLVPEHAENLKKLRGIKFDWGRKDVNQAHVYGARKLTVLLDDFGISHEAEEHGGNGWDYPFTRDGRFYQDLLPFFARHLEFQE